MHFNFLCPKCGSLCATVLSGENIHMGHDVIYGTSVTQVDCQICKHACRPFQFKAQITVCIEPTEANIKKLKG